MIDLHSHTWLSDGSLSPFQLLDRATHHKLQVLAITDHDSVDAYRLLSNSDELRMSDIDLLPGIEISASWDNQEIHILGLMIDTEQTDLNRLVTRQQDRRRERAQAISIKLEKAGITGLMRYVNDLPCKAVGRNHVADFLILAGAANNKQQAFSKFLAKRGRSYVAADWCSVGEAVEIIKAAGGVAVLAHPDRYTLSKPGFKRLIGEFCETGGEGLEVSYSNLNPDTLQNLARLSADLGLWASVGSDFHSPEHNWMELGRIRMLPAICRERAIWHHPRWESFARPVMQEP